MRAPKKRDFFVNIFQKVPKNGYGFFKQIGAKQCVGMGELKNQFGRPKKKVVKFFNFFLKIRPPPIEKILDPPLLQNIVQVNLFPFDSQKKVFFTIKIPTIYLNTIFKRFAIIFLENKPFLKFVGLRKGLTLI